jgi:glycerol kinase
VIVWQDKRQEALLAEIESPRLAHGSVERSGLPLDPYFSAGKLAWLLANDDARAGRADAGTLRLGTVDAFLVDRLGGRFATDLSTASRTQLLAAGGRDWDESCWRVRVEREWLPRSARASGAGRAAPRPLAGGAPACAQLVDQQAALAGSGAVRRAS